MGSVAPPFYVAPNGLAFVRDTVCPGVLPRMLSEILDTRIMIKGAMKRWAPTSSSRDAEQQQAATKIGRGAEAQPPPPAFSRRVLQRVLNARQFGLKMIANVTYGYTSASFSGRMPFAELADAIVESGRAQPAVTRGP